MMRLTAIALLLAACRATGSPSAGAIAWQSPIDVARGGGTKGPWHQNESSFDYVDDPTVALAADGSAAVAWVDQFDKDVHFQIYERDGTPRLARATNVSRTPGVFSWLPRIVVSGDHVHVLWQEIVFSGGSHGGEIYFARSRDGGATFDPPINLSRSIEGDGKARIDAKRWHNGSLALARAPGGTLHAAWTTYDGPLWYATSTDGGASFGEPVHVAGTQTEPARAPSLAIAGDGTTYLAWTYGEDRSADIHVAVARAERFGAPTRIARTATYSDAPKLAVDHAGTLHVAYAESTGGPFDPARVHYTRSRDGARSFEAAVVLGDGKFPALAVDATHVVVAWELPTNVGLGIAVARDGKRFTNAITIPHSAGEGSNGSQQGHLMEKLAQRGTAIAVVNAALAPGRGSRVWLMRGTLAE